MPTQYVVMEPFNHAIADRVSLEARLFELGLEREAFTIKEEADGRTCLKFWEPDRVEALRILAKLEGHA